MPLECGECFRRSIGRGGKSVRAESDPRKDRDKGELVKEGRVPDFLGLSEQAHPDTSPQSLLLLVFLFHLIPPPSLSRGLNYIKREGLYKELPSATNLGADQIEN